MNIAVKDYTNISHWSFSVLFKGRFVFSETQQQSILLAQFLSDRQVLLSKKCCYNSHDSHHFCHSSFRRERQIRLHSCGN